MANVTANSNRRDSHVVEIGGVPLSLQALVANYVRVLCADAERSALAIEKIKSGAPYVEFGYGAMAMIDVSGYSALTSALSSMGKIASEVITDAIGGYLSKLTEVVYLYGGDIIKFLGDAVLIFFAIADQDRFPGDEEATHANAVRRATLCCLHVMSRYPFIDIESPTEVRTREPSATPTESTYNTRNRASFSSKGAPQATPPKTHRLTLHVAVTAGDVEHVVVGSPERMDYFIQGLCLDSLGEVVDHAKSGELGISVKVWEALSARFALAPLGPSREYANDVVFEPKQQGPLLNALARSKSANGVAVMANEMTHDRDVAGFLIGADLSGGAKVLGTQLEMLSKFCNQSIVYKINKSMGQNEGMHNDARELLKIRGEFRTVSVLFASFKPKLDTAKSQKATALMMAALKKHDGFFCQYSVDDKGHTLLSLFGLPPLARDQDAANALRAGVQFATSMLRCNLGAAHVAVATGEVMFAPTGTPFRMEASFRGDVVNLSARLLGLGDLAPAGWVLCEEVARDACVGNAAMSLQALGAHAVKGKSAPIEVFGFSLEMMRAIDGVEGGAPHVDGIGHREERAILVEAFNQWVENDVGRIVIIEAPSGMGKSTLLEDAKNTAHMAFRDFCVCKGSEIEEGTPYLSLGTMISFIYHQTPTGRFKRMPSKLFASNGSLPTVRTYASNNNDRNVDMAEFAGFLKLYDIDRELAPLLRLVLPFLKIEDTESTRSLDGQSQRRILGQLVKKIIGDFITYHKTVFFFDDTQVTILITEVEAVLTL
ncbi:Adenylate cyclase type 10 [Irineochytrium annulatum]|nr:Adenylate cyclase type 10 [Irineochytrium annulatum]